MKKYNLIRFSPEREIWIALLAFFASLVLNYVADFFVGSALFYVLYEGLLVLGVCLFFPVWFTIVNQRQPLSSIGITTRQWPKAVLIGILIAALTTGGRLMGMGIHFPNTSALLYLIACMLMSTLFEEVFFRGFLQTRFEKSFGMIPAILLSGLCFSLYHIGYNNVRGDTSELLTLFFTGVFFSISFRITNNIITSYIVNLPQAILTFLGEPRYIAYAGHFNATSAAIAVMTTLIGLFLIGFFNSKLPRETKFAPGAETGS